MQDNGRHPLSRLWFAAKERWLASEPDLAAYRRLVLQIDLRLPRPDSPRSVLLVTPNASSLCARGSALLARCAADEIRRPILLIDASPNDPEATRILGSDGRPGLSEFLADPGRSLESLVVPTSHENVSFLPAGARHAPAPEGDAAALLSLLKGARLQYDLVLLSGGPVLDDSLALTAVPCVGCVLLLAIEDGTRVEDLDAAQDAISRSEARQVGLVLATGLRGQR